MRFIRSIVANSGSLPAGTVARVTDIGGNTPLDYRLTENGPLTRGPIVIPGDGIVRVFTEKEELRFAVVTPADEVLYEEDFENTRVSALVTVANLTAGVAPANTVAPVLSGTTAGSPSNVTNGTWTGTATITFTYEWFLAGILVPGATAASFTSTAVTDVGKTLRARVTGNNLYGNVSAFSNTITLA